MGKKRTILVIGATGAQGGSVARHLLSQGEVVVRCLTRHPDAEKAKALQKAGAEVVEGDLDDRRSLRDAMKGCYGVFGVTNFWEHFDKEYGQGKNLVDAVAKERIAHFVFSTLPYSKKISHGELEVPHFDMKAQLEEYTRELGLKATFVHVAFYFENFLSFFPLQKRDDGAWGFGFPQGDTPLAGVAIDDVGSIVAVLFENPEVYVGRTVGIVGDDLKGSQYAETMTRVLGRRVVYSHIPRDVYASFGFPGADDLANMFEFNRLYIPQRRADMELCQALNPEMQTFETWLKAHKGALAEVFEREHAGAH